jgi:hypothetical protein
MHTGTHTHTRAMGRRGDGQCAAAARRPLLLQPRWPWTGHSPRPGETAPVCLLLTRRPPPLGCCNQKHPLPLQPPGALRVCCPLLSFLLAARSFFLFSWNGGATKKTRPVFNTCTNHLTPLQHPPPPLRALFKYYAPPPPLLLACASFFDLARERIHIYFGASPCGPPESAARSLFSKRICLWRAPVLCTSTQCGRAARGLPETGLQRKRPFFKRLVCALCVFLAPGPLCTPPSPLLFFRHAFVYKKNSRFIHITTHPAYACGETQQHAQAPARLCFAYSLHIQRQHTRRRFCFCPLI